MLYCPYAGADCYLCTSLLHTVNSMELSITCAKCIYSFMYWGCYLCTRFFTARHVGLGSKKSAICHMLTCLKVKGLLGVTCHTRPSVLQTERDRQRETHCHQCYRQRDTLPSVLQTEGDRQRETDRERQTERDRQRETDRERQTERDRQRETHCLTHSWMPLKKEPKRPIIPRNSTLLRFFTMNSSHTLEMPYRVAPASTSRSPSSLWSPAEGERWGCSNHPGQKNSQWHLLFHVQIHEEYYSFYSVQWTVECLCRSTDLISITTHKC